MTQASYLRIFILFYILFSLSSSSLAVNPPVLKQLIKKHYKYQYTNKDSAEYYLNQAIEYAYEDKDALINVHNVAVWFYCNRQTNIDSAIVHSNIALGYITDQTDSITQARTYNRKGFLDSKRRDFKSAIYWLERSLGIKLALKDNPDISNSYTLLANVYRKLAIYDQAMNYYDQALETASDSLAIALTKRNQGILLLDQNKPDQALTNFLECLEIYSRKKKPNRQIILTKIHLAETYYQIENYEDATRLLRECEQYFLENEKKHNQAKVHRLMAKVYFKIGEYQLAEKYCLKSLKKTKTSQFEYGQMRSMELLVSIYDQMNEHEKAFSYQKKYQEISDSLAYNEIRIELLNEGLIAEIEANENQITVLKQEKIIHRLAVLCFAFMGILVAFMIYWLAKNKVKKLNEKIDLEQKNQVSLLQKLQDQKMQTEKVEMELQKHIRLLSDTNGNTRTTEMIQALEQLYQFRLLTEEDWSDFKLLFSQVHPSFLAQLKRSNTKLSNTDIKVATLMRLNLENAEIGNMLAISPESIRKAKYRIRQKLQMSNNKELQSYVFSL